ncbi:hypothetical protein HDU84_000600 [Entophlyctis sp. JEL0112]|nr:hypothetical protein HDU84_000600 [Entophlyctis sp. JEL0112]
MPTHPLRAHVYVLPTLDGNIVMHTRLPVPSSPAQRFMIVAGVIMRRWRYRIWDDLVASHWHRLAHSKSPETSDRLSLSQRIYDFGNRIGTRDSALAEYFLKSIPVNTQEMEIIHPPYISQRQIKMELSKYLQSRHSYRRALVIYTLFGFPSIVLVAKILLPIMNIAFVYLLFRTVSAWRAIMCGDRIQKIVDSNRVVFTASPAFAENIDQACEQVSRELEERDGTLWRWNKDAPGDLHDQAVEVLEKETLMHEWTRTYARARMIFFMRATAARNKVQQRPV